MKHIEPIYININKINVLLILMVLLIFPIAMFGQSVSHSLGGNIYDSDKQTIIGATVLLLKEGEADFSMGTATTLDGSFIFQNVPIGKYTLKVSFIGYKEAEQQITVADKEQMNVNVFLEEVEISLSEIVITANTVEKFADKTTFRFTDTDRKSFSNALTLLQVVPKLQIMDLSLTTVNGKAVKILINGINSEATDLSVINSQDILRVEYYDNPPARFSAAGLGAVVNVITRKNEKGGVISLNLQNAFTTGYGNDVASFKYNFNNSQIGFKYNINYRDLNKRVLDENLEYQFDQITYKKEKKGLDSPYQYEDQLLEINFNNQKPDNYVFSSKFSLVDYDSRRASRQAITQYLPNYLEKVGFSTDKTKNIIPNIDLYFNKTLGSHEILVNLVGTYFDTKYAYTYDEMIGLQSDFHTATQIDGNKYSLIGDFQYTYNFGNQKVNTGVKSLYGSAKQSMSASNDMYTNSENQEITAYAELSGKLNELSYSLSAGMVHSCFDSETLGKSYSFTTIKPSVSLGYTLTENTELNLLYQMNPINPTLAELSPSMYFIDNKYAYSGNPALKPYNKHELGLTYFLNKEDFLFTTEVSATYAKNPILPFFRQDENLILETLDNLNNSQYYNWNVYMQWFPFTSKIVRFTLYAELFRASNSFSDISWKYDGYRVQPMIVVNYQKWNLRAFYLSKSKTLLGQRLQASPSVAAIELSYKPIKNLTTMLAVRYPFYSAWKTSSETHPSALIHKYESESIKDLANMVYVGLVYNFSFGKTGAEIKQKVNNADKDSGVLNRVR